jgi:hypothetical protein
MKDNEKWVTISIDCSANIGGSNVTNNTETSNSFKKLYKKKAQDFFKI